LNGTIAGRYLAPATVTGDGALAKREGTTMMTEKQPIERATLGETLVFFAKLAGFLAALAVFGFAVFWITHTLKGGK
jgi:hypothetical protein